MADVPDINLDELRRRARRRLVGAIVLALAAAVIVPMLLESDPKPLGDDVSVRIPPEDSGKFVNRLSDKSAKTKASDETAKSEAPKEPAKAEPAKMEPAKVEPAKVEPAKVEPAKVEPAKVEPSKVEPAPAVEKAPATVPSTTTPPPAESPSAPSNVPAPKKSIAQAEQKMLGAAGKSGTSAPVHVATQAPAANVAPAASTEASKEGYAVQLAAFADDKGANALANKLKRAAYPAYTEPLSTSRGTLWRVRVGPYPSRDAAVEVRDKLKGEGFSGIVAAAK